MSEKKKNSDTLADRMRAITTGKTTSQPNRADLGQSPTSKKIVRNKRRSERKEAYKQGLLILATGERVKIVVKNISETGARVDFFSGGTSIFGSVVLSVPTLGLQRHVRVVWKDQNSAGLEFEKD